MFLRIKKFFKDKAFYGNITNMRPHQLKIIGDASHSTDDTYVQKVRKNTEKKLYQEKHLKLGKAFLLYNNLRRFLSTIQDKVTRGERLIGKIIHF